MPEGPFQKDRACDKKQIAQQRGSQTVGEQPAEQRTETALQRITQKGKPSKILEGPAQRRSHRPKQCCGQRDRIGVGDAETVRRVDGVRNAQWPRRGAFAVKQPARVVLLNVLLHITAPAKGVVGYIQGRSPKHQQKHCNPQQRTGCKKDAVSVPDLSGRHAPSLQSQKITLFYHKVLFLHRPATNNSGTVPGNRKRTRDGKGKMTKNDEKNLAPRRWSGYNVFNALEEQRAGSTAGTARPEREGDFV